MTSPNDIPDILAGTTGTEQAASAADPNAVAAAVAQDPNLLNEILQPGFVEVVNELAGDAAPTLGATQTVSQAYEGANNESLTDAFNDLQTSAGLGAGATTVPPGATASDASGLNPQPLPPAESPTDLIHDQLEQIQSELAALSGSAGEGSSAVTMESAPVPTFEGGQLQPGEFASAQTPGFEAPTFETAPTFEAAPTVEVPTFESAPTFEAPTYETAQHEPEPGSMPNETY